MSEEPPPQAAGKSSAEMVHPKAVQSTAAADVFRRLSVWDFVDSSKPWVLVPNGSLGGHFDWVPQDLRVGPWSTAAYAYFVVLWYGTLAAGCYFWPTLTHALWWWDEDSTVELESSSATASAFSMQYPPAYSQAWYYHAFGCIWMLYIIYSVMFLSPLSYKAWATYTVQSWTLLCARHGMCALAPFMPQFAIPAAELMRLPCAVAHTVTFTIWNFALVPYMLLVVFRNDTVKRRNFIAFCTNFRLTNLHLVNIFMCILNVGPFGSPRRRLQWIDFYLATVSAVVYLTWYTCILDRVGVHLYPIFSPRLRNGLVLVTWTGAASLYLTAFYSWRYWMLPR